MVHKNREQHFPSIPWGGGGWLDGEKERMTDGNLNKKSTQPLTSLSLWSVNMNRLWHCKQQRGVRWTARNSVAAVSRAEQRSTLSSFRRSRMAGDLGLKIIPPLSKRNAARSHSSLFYKRKINSTFELELWSHKAGHKHITDGQRKSNWHEITTALNLFCELLLLLTFSSHYK